MRPSYIFALFFTSLIGINFSFFLLLNGSDQRSSIEQMNHVTRLSGLTDPSYTTEARYTRHPGLTDTLVPFMDHPGALEHFPSSSMLAPRTNR